MEFIKAQDLKTVANILNTLQKDVINSAMYGYIETQNKHKLKVDEQVINEIEKYLLDAGYKVYLEQGADFDGSLYTYITLVWGE